MTRRDLLPASSLPLVYFVWAHAGLALALLILVVNPELPSGYFLHPRMAAVVHLVTIAWISGSILGAFYIVAPLALGLPMPVRTGDWASALAFVAGTMGMVAHFWTGRYDRMAWSGMLVLWAVAWVGGRAAAGARRATAPWPVMLHVLLAFGNMIAAGLFGVAMGLDRVHSWFGIPPVSGAIAHAHLAAIGWPLMMVVGLAYRLVPMFLPAKMPAGNALAVSAVLIEAGLVVLATALLIGSVWLPVGALLIVAGVVSFARQMRGTVKHRLPRPPALPARDWSTWQAHVALLWLLVAAMVGIVLTMAPAGSGHVRLAWIYGVAGIVGFVAQMVVGIQGRLVPLYAYYRAMAARGGEPPERAANELPSAAFARVIFWLWAVGVPWLIVGLSAGQPASISGASATLFIGVMAGAAYLSYLMRSAGGVRST